jgi:hypothetical protein
MGRHKRQPTTHLQNIPVAVIPQAGRRCHIILDLSFAVRLDQKLGQRRPGAVLQEAVNDTTVPLAPRKPVREIGKVLPRLLEFMTGAPAGQKNTPVQGRPVGRVLANHHQRSSPVELLLRNSRSTGLANVESLRWGRMLPALLCGPDRPPSS